MSFGSERPEGVPAQYRDRPARSRRQFSRHDLLAALFARRPEDRHVAVAGRRRQSLLDGSALAHDDAADRHRAIDTSPSYSPDGAQIVFESDRGGAQQIYVMGGERRRRQAHFLRRGPLFDAGLVAEGRLHRLHQAERRQLRHRRDEAGRIGRTHPHRRFPQRGPDLGAERPFRDVFPQSGGGGAENLHGRYFRPRRISGADAVLWLRPLLERFAWLMKDLLTTSPIAGGPRGFATLRKGYENLRLTIAD